ncbi:hypothetical protein [Bifidobacterium myosotis]|uniref:Cell surface protein n=1 Tax=Bifidobacterium myosotis TaxID=1630166 RepID=A0A5M9ZHF6_9BIFI|nr:hypothetical protein [Bifidobacterium myosotis]KAA8826938.1 hypothetical protein EMO91_10430 [Bifidobacterium myosotis]
MADGRRAPAIMTAALLAICMAAGPGATGAMADGAPAVAARDGAAAVADTKYSIEDLKGVKLVWVSGTDLTVHVADGFDYRKAGPYYMPDGDTHAGVRNLPAGWYTIDTQEPSKADNWSVYAPDGTKIITYTISRKIETLSESQLNGIIMTVDDEPYAKWNPAGNTKFDSEVIGRYDYDLRASHPNAVVRFANVPANWKTIRSGTGDSLYITFEGTDSTGKKLQSKMYHFLGATLGDPGLGNLAGLKAYVNGKAVAGFDYRAIQVSKDRGEAVLTGVPAGWSSETSSDPYHTSVKLTAPNGYTRTIAFDTPVSGRVATLADDHGSKWAFKHMGEFDWRLVDIEDQGEAVPTIASAKPAASIPVSTVYADPTGRNVTVTDTLDRLPDPVSTERGALDPMTGGRWTWTTYRYAARGIRMDVAYATQAFTEARVARIGNYTYPLTQGSDGAWTGRAALGGAIPDTIPVTVLHNDRLKTLTLRKGARDGNVITYASDDGRTQPEGVNRLAVNVASDTDALATVVAKADGKPVDGFDPAAGGTYTVPAGTQSVSLEGIPDGWTAVQADKGWGWTLTGPDGTTTVTYTFKLATSGYSVDDLRNLQITVGGETPENFDYHGGTFKVTDPSGELLIYGKPAGYTLTRIKDGIKLTSPDGLVDVSYRFTGKTAPTYSAEDLWTVTATADGKPVKTFDYHGGEFPVPAGTKSVALAGIPDGWTQRNVSPGLGMTLTSPDGKVSVTYTFKPTGGTVDPTPTYRPADLRGVTATADGEPVSGWDPINGGEYIVPAGTKTVEIGNVPDKWTIDRSDDGMRFTVTSPDGKVTVEYTFTRAQTTHTYGPDDLKGVTATADGRPIDGFDPAGGETAVPAGTKAVALAGVPAGWTSTPLDGALGFTLTSPDGKYTHTYRFTPAAPKYSLDDLKNVTATADGKPVTGFDPSKSDFTVPAGTKAVALDGVPAGWTTVALDGALGFTLTSPDGAFTHTYRFTPEAPRYSLDDLRDVRLLADGTPVDGFDYRGGVTKLPAGASKVTLTGLPAGWTRTELPDSAGWRIESPDRTVSVEYRIEWTEPEHTTGELKGVTALADGKPVDGFDPVNGGTFTVPEGTRNVTLDGIPSGWTSRALDPGLGFTLTSTDGKTVTYRFVPKAHEYTIDDLKGVRAVVDGKTLDTFDYHGGTFTVPAGADVTLGGVPADWTSTRLTDGHGWRIASPDGKVVVEYRFTEAAPSYSLDDLKGLTASADGRRLDGFDYRGGATRVPAGTKRVAIDGVPDGWTSTPLRTGLGFTVASPDGSVTVTYTFVEDAPKYSRDDLKGVTAYADGVLVTGFDPTGVNAAQVPHGTKAVSLKGVPAGWSSTPLAGGLGYTVVAPDRSVIVTYRFTRADAPASAADLRGVTVTPSPAGFDPTVSGTYTLPNGSAAPALKGVPAGWAVSTQRTGHGWTVAVRNGAVHVEYRFDEAYGPADLTGLALTGVDGFDPAKTGPYTASMTGAVGLVGVPDGWRIDGLTLTAPDGWTITYKVDRTWMASDLRGATLTVGTFRPAGFDPTRTAAWRIPHAGDPVVQGLPDGVSADVKTAADGTVTVTVTDPDGHTLAVWTLTRMPEYHEDDVADATPSVGGHELKRNPDGSFEAPADGDVTWDLPDGWTASKTVDGDVETWTLTSPDGAVTRTVRIRRAPKADKTGPLGGLLANTGVASWLAVPAGLLAALGAAVAGRNAYRRRNDR